MMRWYCTGTSIAWLTRCFSASASQDKASNFGGASTTVPPMAMVGKKQTSVVLEHSEVPISVTDSGP